MMQFVGSSRSKFKKHPRLVFGAVMVATMAMLVSQAQSAENTTDAAWKQSLAATDSPLGAIASSAADWPTTTTSSSTTTTAAPAAPTTANNAQRQTAAAAASPSAPAPSQQPSAPSSSNTSSNADGADPNAWRLIASEDFNGSSVSNAWGLYSGVGTAGVGTRKASMVSVSNGAAHINGANTVTGGMAQHVNQVYGRWSIRAKMDKGQGYAPAILLWPDSERWPQDGEIDIIEIEDGNRNTAGSTLHWGSDNKQAFHSVNGDFTQWHTYTVEWFADHITFYVDGNAHWTSTNPASIPKTNMHLALQLDTGKCGSNWIGCPDATTPANVALHVDWVRVYQRA